MVWKSALKPCFEETANKASQWDIKPSLRSGFRALLAALKINRVRLDWFKTKPLIGLLKKKKRTKELNEVNRINGVRLNIPRNQWGQTRLITTGMQR